MIISNSRIDSALGKKIAITITFLLLALIWVGLKTAPRPALAGENAVSAFSEDPRFFQVSNYTSSVDITLISIGEGKVVWREKDAQTGEMTFKFFDGQQTQDLHTYSAAEWSQVSGSTPYAIIFDNCVIYKLPDFTGTWHRWWVYDPANPEPHRPLVSDNLYPVAEGNKAVWVRSVYQNQSDTEPQSINLHMYTCGTGSETLAGSALDGTQTGPVPFGYGEGVSGPEMKDGLVVWTANRTYAGNAGDVTSEVWVSDGAGTRKVWDCLYPYLCDLEPNSSGISIDFLRDWQHRKAQTAVDGGVIVLRVRDLRTYDVYGVLIYQPGRSTGTYFFPGSGAYAQFLVRDGYVSWVHYSDTNTAEDLQVYNLSTGKTVNLPYDNWLTGDYVMERGIVLYQDGFYGWYLYDLASAARQLITDNFDAQGLYFNNGRVLHPEVAGNDLVLRYFDGATTPVEIARFPNATMNDLGDYLLGRDGRAWWRIKQSYTYLTCDDPNAGTGTDIDLFTWDPVNHWVRQVTSAGEINDVGFFSSQNGTVVWTGERKNPGCYDVTPGGIRQVFIGGEATRSISGSVLFRDGARDTQSLPDLEMVFTWAQDNTFSNAISQTIYTDANGAYLVSPPETGNVQGVFKFEIRLKDRQGWIVVQHGDPPALVTFETPSYNFQNLAEVFLDINISNVGSFKNPSIGTANQGRLDDLAEIYYFTHQAALFADQKLSLVLDSSLPEEVRAFSLTSGVYHSADAPEYINIEDIDSSLRDNDWPDNREWHEFSHHIMTDALLGGDNQIPAPRLTPSIQMDVDDNRNGVFNETLVAWSGTTKINAEEGPITVSTGLDINHLGYANSTTTDSLVEGFAEFTSMVIADTMTSDPRPEIYKYGGTRENLEALHQTWTDEEFAVASLLWDLYDSHVDSYNLDTLQGWTLGKTLDDHIDLTLADLWGRLNKSTIRDMKDVYDALTDLNVDSDGDGIGDVDELFILHGFFVDNAPYKKYSPGEEIGRAGYGQQVQAKDNILTDDLLWDDGDGIYDPPQDKNPEDEKIRVPASTIRRDLTLPDYSVLRLSFQDSQSANPVKNLTLQVAITYDAPYQEYSHAYDLSMAGDGDMPIYMPILTATATITATAGGYADSAPITVTSQEYWQAMDADIDFVSEYTFTLTPIPSHALTVTVGGEGFGSVVISPTKEIDCNPYCSYIFPADSSVPLTAVPEMGSAFAGWGGDCVAWGSDPGADLVLSADMVCTATFEIALDPYPRKVYLPLLSKH